MVARIESLNPGSDERGRSSEEPWPPGANGIFVFILLAILVFLLAFLCALYHTWQFEEKLRGQLDEGPVVSHGRPDSRDFRFDGKRIA
jgi:hypothetical protein